MKLLYTNGTGSSQTTTQANRIVVPSDYIANESFSVYTSSRLTPPTDNWAAVTTTSATGSLICPEGIYHNGENVVCKSGWIAVTSPTIKYMKDFFDSSDTITTQYTRYNPALDTYIWVHRYSGYSINQGTTIKYGARFTQHNYSNETVLDCTAYLSFAWPSSYSQIDFIPETGANAFIDDNGYLNVDAAVYFRKNDYSSGSNTYAIMVVRVVRD